MKLTVDDLFVFKDDLTLHADDYAGRAARIIRIDGNGSIWFERLDRPGYNKLIFTDEIKTECIYLGPNTKLFELLYD